MKKVLKAVAVTGLAAASVFTIASCGGNKKADYTIGVLQLVTHDALGAATKGFKDYIEENKPAGKTIEYDVQIPEADAPTMLTMANKLVRNCDLVMGNATPAITQLVASRKTEGKTNVPLLFTSVTDPIAAELVSDWTDKAGTNITGTSDINPVEAQIELMFESNAAKDGTVDTIGFLYNIGEVNSKTQCDMAEKYLKENHAGTKTYTQTVSDASQIGAAAKKLCDDGCDYIYLPTDNLIASNVPAVTNVTNVEGVPTVCGEEGMVNNGGTFTYSISYYELGKLTGKMACDILFNNKTADSIAIQGLTDSSKMSFAYNKDAIKTMSLALSDAFKSKYSIE